MKKNSVIILICMALFAVNVCNSKNNNGNNQTVETMEDKTQVKEPVLGLGNPITANFSGDAWLKMLSTQPEYDCNIYNVTFAPGIRNNWHSLRKVGSSGDIINAHLIEICQLYRKIQRNGMLALFIIRVGRFMHIQLFTECLLCEVAVFP